MLGQCEANNSEDRSGVFRTGSRDFSPMQEAVMTVLDLKLADHSRHQEMIRTVQWSLIKGKQVTGQYQSPYQERPVKLTLHPYRLCLAGQAWYLIARSSEGQVPQDVQDCSFSILADD